MQAAYLLKCLYPKRYSRTSEVTGGQHGAAIVGVARGAFLEEVGTGRALPSGSSMSINKVLVTSF